jgi:hypothetical protein
MGFFRMSEDRRLLRHFFLSSGSQNTILIRSKHWFLSTRTNNKQLFTMCATDTEAQRKSAPAADNSSTMAKAFQTMQMVTVALLITTIALLVSTVVLAVSESDSSSTVMTAAPATTETVTTTVQVVAYENPCEGKKPDLPNVQCVIDAVEQTGEQAGANVTKGYNGKKNTTAVPLTIPYSEAGLCPVNVHWHLGAEHYSLGQFDETGK